MKSEGSAPQSLKRIYRALLRSSAAAVRFSRPATKNTRRYLRDEIAHELQNAGSPQTRLDAMVHSTMILHLASSLHPRISAPDTADKEKDAAPDAADEQNDVARDEADEENDAGPSRPTQHQMALPHRLVANLSSLTYHHLSPNTQMQSKQSRHMRSSASQRIPKRITTMARVLDKIEHDSPFDADGLPGPDDLGSALTGPAGTINATHLRLAFLQPTRKPPRGPAMSRVREWDAQDYTKHDTPGVLALMQKDLDAIQDVLARMSDRDDVPPKHLEKLAQEAKELKGLLKSKTRKLAAPDTREQAGPIIIDMLANLISAAQDSENLWLGKQRWLVRQRNGFLPP